MNWYDVEFGFEQGYEQGCTDAQPTNKGWKLFFQFIGAIIYIACTLLVLLCWIIYRIVQAMFRWIWR
jgi:hypothetical protein